jgi:coenzyme F420-0:L-glutamate ligase/coenzyme F420-1:gamma-L-glutamate ligase
MKEIKLFALEGIPLIQKQDQLGKLIIESARKNNFDFINQDIIIVASKIVSKAEGQLVDTPMIQPAKKTLLLAKKLGIDPKNLEVILRESKRLLLLRPDLILTQHRLGFICTKAGVDSSNTTSGPKGKVVSLLPKNPDLSAKKIRKILEAKTKKKLAIIINDTFGRPDRTGSVGMAIGISGIAAIYKPKTTQDLFGKKRHPAISQVDEIAAAASLLMGQTNEGRPVVIVRGVDYQPSEKDNISMILQPFQKYYQDIEEILAQSKNK